MRTDASISLVPIGTNLSMVAAAGASIPSPNTIDLMGSGVGTPPPNIIGNTTLFGTDLGIGAVKTQLAVATGTAFTTADSCTLNVQFQGAPDTGAAGGYQPGTWQTFVETGPLTAAQLTAQTVIARFDWPPAFPANERPRYMRLLFVTPSGDVFTAGTIAYAIPVDVRDDYSAKYQPSNFSVR
jgi:hypothetical protein